MIKEALQYIVGLNKAEVQEVNGVKYSDKKMVEILPDERMASELNVSTLTAMVEYIKTNPDGLNLSPYIIHVREYNEVALTFPLTEIHKQRPVHMVAMNRTKQFEFGKPMDRELFNIALQSQFVREQNSTTLLQYIGTMSEDEGVKIQDDGVTQSITAKTGIATLSQVSIPNPLELTPYRTFQEIVHPESLFVFRIHKGMGCALYEADGGAWKVQCIENIKVWFEGMLATEIENGNVVILA